MGADDLQKHLQALISRKGPQKAQVRLFCFRKRTEFGNDTFHTLIMRSLTAM